MGVPAAYDAQDRLVSFGDANYTHTPAGELQVRNRSGALTNFEYDPLGNLRNVTASDGTQIEYAIDPTNRRTGKSVNGVRVQGFLWSSQLRIAAELDAAGAVVSRFVYGTRVNVPEYLIKGGANYRILTDHLGSPKLVVNTATGEIAQRMDYDPWGRVTLDTNPGFQPFGFAGGLYDPMTSLVRFGVRDYDAEVGRWTAKDPVGFGGGLLNLYNYGAADPVSHYDPSGFYSPEGHFSITLVAALAKGMPIENAMRLAWDTAAADWTPSFEESQATKNAYWHAMCAAGIDSAVCQQQFEDFVYGTPESSPCSPGASTATEAQRLHALQDSFALGHEGFQEYTGYLLDLPLRHFAGDWYPMAPDRFDATLASYTYLTGTGGGW